MANLRLGLAFQVILSNKRAEVFVYTRFNA